METDKAKEKDGECWVCNFKWVVWKDLNEKKNNYLNEVRVWTKWNLMGKHLKQENCRCKVRAWWVYGAKKWLTEWKQSVQRREWQDMRSEKNRGFMNNSEDSGFYSGRLKKSLGGFQQRSKMVWFMFLKGYSSGCAENRLWYSMVRSRETVGKLF